MNRQSIVEMALRAAAPLLIVFLVWWPEFNHYRIDRTVPDITVIENLAHEPSSKDLTENAEINLFATLGVSVAEQAQTADLILSGQLNVPLLFAAPYKLRGWPSDLTPSGPTLQLIMASLAVEDLLLREYETGGDRRHYLLARDRILAFAEWESRQHKPLAFLWNDHAIAARVSVLIRLWRILRDDAETTLPQRTELVALVQRSGELLSKPNLFTVRTNHGVMQNLALLQISAAFPNLAKAPVWRNLAVARLEMQLLFYVSDEGVVLEHSAGYHLFGHDLLAYALKLVRLNRLEPSQRLVQSNAATTHFKRLLLRPDGSLPLVGNTAGGNHVVNRAESPVPRNDAGSHIYPLSGYAIWWGSEAAQSQTLVAWAKHDGHGHKHADEPSIHLWSRGIDWVTATGYWPYGARGYDQANGWLGSNAPHARGEDMQSPRTVQLLASGETGSVRAIDIENVRQSGLTVRRQIIQLSSEQILVLDTVRGATSPVETIWTLDHRLSLQEAGAQRFKTSATTDGYFLEIDLASDNSVAFQKTLYKGNWSPFAGWVVTDSGPVPAPSLVVERPLGDSKTATLFTIDNQSEPRVIKLLADAHPDNWTIEIQTLNGVERVQRSGFNIAVTTQLGTSSLVLVAPPSMALRQHNLSAAMSQALELYPPWRALGFYHQRIYIAVAALWVAVEVLFGFLAWWRLRRMWMNAVVLAGWGGFGWWIHAIYLV